MNAMKTYPDEVLRKAAEKYGIPDAPRDDPFYQPGMIKRVSKKKRQPGDALLLLTAKLSHFFQKLKNK